jgi:hypothetical protein
MIIKLTEAAQTLVLAISHAMDSSELASAACSLQTIASYGS